MMPSEIEWCDETINPYPGCTKIAAGCLNCYAERTAHWLACMGQEAYKRTITDKRWNGHLGFQAGHLTLPLRWRKGRRIFVNSMGDLFHEAICFHYIRDVWELMRKTERHTYLILTKRIKTAKSFAEWLKEPPSEKFALPNVWLGVSCSGPDDLWMLDELAAVKAAIRFVSFEPLLRAIRIPQDALRSLDWVIVGGESGPGARPMHPQWVRDLRDQCVAAGVAFFFKQWGEWAPVWAYNPEKRNRHYCFDPPSKATPDLKEYNGLSLANVFRFGKKRAGRVLDGRTWDEYPELQK